MHGETRRETRRWLGARIRDVREAKGLSRRALSELADLPEAMIASMEDGHARVTFENLLCLARALDVPLGNLFQ